jgi:tryptophan-rich sensory protein
VGSGNLPGAGRRSELRTRSWPTDALALIAPLAVGALGSIPTARSIPTWYRTLDTPSWKPPDVVFGPVWTTLYTLMGVALVLIRRQQSDADRAQLLFGLQLALNLAWSFVFFGGRDPRAGLAVIVVLWTAVAATTVAFARIRPLAGFLLVPYLAWVTFATALNAEIARRNP